MNQGILRILMVRYFNFLILIIKMKICLRSVTNKEWNIRYHIRESKINFFPHLVV